MVGRFVPTNGEAERNRDPRGRGDLKLGTGELTKGKRGWIGLSLSLLWKQVVTGKKRVLIVQVLRIPLAVVSPVHRLVVPERREA
jgi:hypothetical protein